MVRPRRARVHRDRRSGAWITTLFHPGGYPAASHVCTAHGTALTIALAWVDLLAVPSVT